MECLPMNASVAIVCVYMYLPYTEQLPLDEIVL